MYVIKRDGSKAAVSFDEILRRIEYMVGYPYLLPDVDAAELAKEVITQLISGIKTTDIDKFTARRAASKVLLSLNYEVLAARVLVDNHHKDTCDKFSTKMTALQERLDDLGVATPMLSNEFYEYVMEHASEIDARIEYRRDFQFDYFGFETLYSQSYLLRVNGKVIERPQDMFMRVAVFMYMNTHDGLEGAFKAYDLMSQMYCIQASPTLFNAGLKKAGCISCFLADSDDSKEGIQRVVTEVTNASAACGGIAFSATRWRSKGSLIRGSNDGRTNGIVPFIQWAQAGVDAFNQGSRRRGSLAVYLDIHHPDLIDFLQLRVHGGDEKQRCRDVFLGLFVSDIFMRRVNQDHVWSFFDSPQLNDLYGDEYEKLYIAMEAAREYKCQMRAREVWKAIFQCKRDSGLPYLLAKDTVNRTNNQQNIGIIRTSNLCAEIVEVCDDRDDNPDNSETACCTLASIALPMFVEDLKQESNEFPLEPSFNYKKLTEVVHVLVKNLNHVIDKSYYPSSAAKRGSAHRPIGIGVQGLADVFFKFKIAFDSPEARELNKRIFETIYYSALSKSAMLARDEFLRLKRAGAEPAKFAGAYATFTKDGGPPLLRGKFNFELHGLREGELLMKFDWDSLREVIGLYGVRNSLLIALMPTASTSHILRNTECFEPLTSNIYLRKILSGEFYVVNKYLYNDLWKNGMWSADLIEHLKSSMGSVQNITHLPAALKSCYKTAWELPQSHVVELAADRQKFVDQSQSMNLYFEEFNINVFTASHFAGWKSGLKTLSYYIRQRPAVRPIQFTSGLEVTPGADEKRKLHLESLVTLDCQVCGT